MDFSKLEKSINYQFKNKSLLEQAFRHKSYSNNANLESNEKFEFLGDSILEFVSSKYIYLNYKDLKEGEMTKVRADVVCEQSLYKIAQKHNFSDFLQISKSQKNLKNGMRPAMLADSVEALIAAMYFDSDLETVESFIIENLKDEIFYASQNVGMKDYKTVLQEKLQEKGNVEIKYSIIKEQGPDHNKIFTAQVELNGIKLAQGEGKTKKEAEAEAAQVALKSL